MLTILSFANPKVRLATCCSLRMTRFNMFCANPYIPRVVVDVDPYRRDRYFLFWQQTEVHFVTVTTLDSRDACPYKSCGIFIILSIAGSAFCNHNELGRPHGKPASFLRKHCGRPYRRDIDRCFGYRTNIEFYVTLHNKKETRGGLPSACLHLALKLNYRSRISLRLTIAQSLREAGI